ncbi:hypothetical protein V6N12_068285 [Hibiscus sabdariffa]|uniref:Uncharacterized protein n=1 Tax=Hibiscus sabdariffa TaxID=183260 RepID=A0ABR2FPI7_9ROSI
MVSSIPDRLSLTNNERVHQIKVMTKEFEEERIFIDDKVSPSHFKGVAISSSDSDLGVNSPLIDSPIFEVHLMQNTREEITTACNPATQAYQNCGSGLELHEVPIIPRGSSEIRTINECSSDSGPNYVAGSFLPSTKLLNIHVKAIDPNGVRILPFETRYGFW